MRINNKAQVTIFIIVAIVIIGAILAYFLLFYQTKPQISVPTIKEPQQYIEKCVEDAATEAVDIMMPQGGYINATHYKLDEGIKVQYLCYNNLFYKPCVMQEPMYISHLQNEITNYIQPRIENCFLFLKSELERENYEIEMGTMSLTTELMTNIVRVKINRLFEMKKQEESRRFESFKINFNSPLYNLAIVAQEIANRESKLCYFESLGFMIYYPKFSIDRKAVGSGEGAARIYIIEDRNTEKKLNIAIRSCAIPAGI